MSMYSTKAVTTLRAAQNKEYWEDLHCLCLLKTKLMSGDETIFDISETQRKIKNKVYTCSKTVFKIILKRKKLF